MSCSGNRQKLRNNFNFYSLSGWTGVAGSSRDDTVATADPQPICSHEWFDGTTAAADTAATAAATTTTTTTAETTPAATEQACRAASKEDKDK